MSYTIRDPIRDPIHDPIRDPIRDPVRDPVRSDPGFVDAATFIPRLVVRLQFRVLFMTTVCFLLLKKKVNYFPPPKEKIP